MAAWEECSADDEQGASSVAPRAEELFNNLANEEVVSSESAGLVVALAYLDLHVTEEQVVEATREILQPTEKQFSKDAFLRFVEMLRPQPSAAQPSLDESADAAPVISPTEPYDSNRPNHSAPFQCVVYDELRRLMQPLHETHSLARHLDHGCICGHNRNSDTTTTPHRRRLLAGEMLRPLRQIVGAS